MSMTAENFDLLVTALESGRYAQAQHRLRALARDADFEGHGYCCLGVYCVERGVDLDQEVYNSDSSFFKELGQFGGTDDIDGTPLTDVLYDFTIAQRNMLARMNDEGHPFSYIAAYLRARRAEFVAEVA